MTNALVNGGTGFSGSHLTERPLSGGGRIFSVHRLVELLDNPAGVVHIPNRPGTPVRTEENIAEATRGLLKRLGRDEKATD